jgi:hypothetical protein
VTALRLIPLFVLMSLAVSVVATALEIAIPSGYTAYNAVLIVSMTTIIYLRAGHHIGRVADNRQGLLRTPSMRGR